MVRFWRAPGRWTRQESSTRYRAVEPSSGSIVIPRRAGPGLAGPRPHTLLTRLVSVVTFLLRGLEYMCQCKDACVAVVHLGRSSSHAISDRGTSQLGLPNRDRPAWADVGAIDGSVLGWVKDYLAHKKTPPPKTLP
jgi:hypothetical protein